MEHIYFLPSWHRRLDDESLKTSGLISLSSRLTINQLAYGSVSRAYYENTGDGDVLRYLPLCHDARDY